MKETQVTHVFYYRYNFAYYNPDAAIIRKGSRLARSYCNRKISTKSNKWLLLCILLNIKKPILICQTKQYFTSAPFDNQIVYFVLKWFTKSLSTFVLHYISLLVFIFPHPIFITLRNKSNIIRTNTCHSPFSLTLTR